MQRALRPLPSKGTSMVEPPLFMHDAASAFANSVTFGFGSLHSPFKSGGFGTTQGGNIHQLLKYI